MMSDHLWYIGIGSMMNPTALSLRAVFPKQSFWCEILDHRRIFYGPATLVEDLGVTAHAVAHEITREELERLEGREPPSKPVRALLRNGPNVGTMIEGLSSVDFRTFLHGLQAPDAAVGDLVEQKTSGASARVVALADDGVSCNFTNRVSFDKVGVVTINDIAVGVPQAISFPPPAAALPSERYVALMVEGAKAVGMDAKEVEKFVATPCIPRKKPHERQRIVVHDNAVRRFSEDELRNAEYVVFRGMVFEGKPFRPGWKPRLWNGIADLSYDLSKQIYDPLYGPPPESPYDSWEGWAALEDIAVNGPFLHGYKHIGWVESARARL